MGRPEGGEAESEAEKNGNAPWQFIQQLVHGVSIAYEKAISGQLSAFSQKRLPL
jgi:hypothetical protein